MWPTLGVVLGVAVASGWLATAGRVFESRATVVVEGPGDMGSGLSGVIRERVLARQIFDRAIRELGGSLSGAGRNESFRVGVPLEFLVGGRDRVTLALRNVAPDTFEVSARAAGAGLVARVMSTLLAEGRSGSTEDPMPTEVSNPSNAGPDRPGKSVDSRAPVGGAVVGTLAERIAVIEEGVTDSGGPGSDGVGSMLRAALEGRLADATRAQAWAEGLLADPLAETPTSSRLRISPVGPTVGPRRLPFPVGITLSLGGIAGLVLGGVAGLLVARPGAGPPAPVDDAGCVLLGEFPAQGKRSPNASGHKIVDALRMPVGGGPEPRAVAVVGVTDEVVARGAALTIAEQMAANGRSVVHMDLASDATGAAPGPDEVRRPGVAEVLRGEVRISRAIRRTGRERLVAITVGGDGSACRDPLGGRGIGAIVSRLLEIHDMVVVSTPALDRGDDPVGIGLWSDIVLLAASDRTAGQSSISTAAAMCRRLGGEVGGWFLIANGTSDRERSE